MAYVKDSLYNTLLPTLEIEENELYKKYPQIGFGEEASVHKYDEDLAFKVFIFFSKKECLSRKFEKIELMGKLRDESACFPVGLVGYEDKKKEGYFCDLVNPLSGCKDFEALTYLKDMRKLLDYIVQADEAIQRFHKMGLVLGDVKEDNIMIDENGNVKFVDTDNWMYGDYGFDLEPGRAHLLRRTYNKEASLIDSDRFAFAMMAIQYFIKGTLIRLHCSEAYFKKMVELLNVSPEVKDGLRLIFSDAKDKPYVGPILKMIDPNQPLISESGISRLNRIF